MATAWIIEFVAYAALVSGATWLARRHTTMVVGVTLMLCLLVTTAGYFGTSFDSRVTLEAIQAVVIINTARIAFASDPDWPSALIVSLAIMDLALCAGFGTGAFHKGDRIAIADFDLDLYGNVTNLIFALQCLAVAAPGAIDAFVGRGSRRAASGRVGSADAALDALRAQVEKL